MKYFSLLLFVSFLVNLNVAGQMITVSDEIPFRSDQKYSIVGKLKNHVLLYKERVNEFKIQAYNEKMGLGWEKELELDKKKPTPIDIIGLQDYFYLIYRYKDEGEHLVKIHKYNAAANLRDSTIATNYGKRFTVPNPEVILSENKEVVLLFSTEFYNELEFTVFSLKDMKVLWEGTYAPQDMQNGYNLQQIVVDNNGAMHLIIIRENDRLKKDKPHHFEIWSRYPDNEEVITTKVPLEGKLTYDVVFKPDNLNQALLAGGFFSDKNKARTQGYYYLNIPYQSSSDYQLQFHEFDPKFMEELVEGKVKVEKGLFDVHIQDFAIRKDGGLLMIGEQRKETDRRNNTYGFYSGEQIPTAADYFYEDIFLLAVHPTGAKHWEQILHKKQYSQGDDGSFSSFFMVKTPRQLRLVYNDEVRNEGIVSEYLIQGNGTTDRKSVLNTENQELKLRVRESIQVAHNEIIVPSELRSKLKLVRVVY